MEIFREIHPLKAFLKKIRLQGKSIGLVPTMGALHNGHLSLLEAAKRENSVTVCSIYINPAQFNNPTDLERYPRTIDTDIELLKKVECDILFCPENKEMYPEKPVIHFDFGHLDSVMEGKFRPGHFSGVALVVAKFFNIVQPNNVYFGQKDWQQFSIIKRLADELMFDMTLHSIPTVRESGGLAQSSRNQRLNQEERARATIFYRALTEASTLLKTGAHLADVKKKVQMMFKQHDGVRLEYFELAERTNLNLLDSVESANNLILCIAGYVGDVRLIDNMFIDLSSD